MRMSVILIVIGIKMIATHQAYGSGTQQSSGYRPLLSAFWDIGLGLCRAFPRVNGLANLKPVVHSESLSCRGAKGLMYIPPGGQWLR